ncbi:Hypp6873 [Branchiostoma lanceolatum]|uniref:Hypp6873 protein n=1 Tax=Branchiostoma lanceolatum TaxID=7740 RepID=A0A8J9YVW3_BRALA|nr:Hypp6873 [Branchiostoma lanceolatum]
MAQVNTSLQHLGLPESWDNLIGFMEERLNNFQDIIGRKFSDNKPAISAYDNINRFRAVLHMRVLEGKYLQALQKDERYQALHKATSDNVVSDWTSEYPQADVQSIRKRMGNEIRQGRLPTSGQLLHQAGY